MWRKTLLLDFIKSYLPQGAQLLVFEEPYQGPAIVAGDLDGDGILEAIAAYRWREKVYVMILKEHYNFWYVATIIEGEGYDINYIRVAPVTNVGAHNLIIGWQVGGIWAKLDIFQWTPQGSRKVLRDNIVYSKIEVKDMPGDKGVDGKAEIAIWIHDTGEAYKIEVYRWEDGRLVSARDVYPFYFRRVISFYEARIREIPDAGYYWYYLADAQIKARMPKQALKSIEVALNLKYPYPSREALMKLREEVLSELKV